MIKLVNGLDKGDTFEHQTVCNDFDSLPEIRDAQKLAMQELWFNASVFVRARRDLGLTGDHAGPRGQQNFAAFLSKEEVGADGYAKVSKAKLMVPLIADRLDEPNEEACVDMLLALPAEESFFYSKEAHVLDMSCKSREIFKEIEERYGFVGGSHDQYIAYWLRDDVPKSMWHWDVASAARATSGFTAVLKKCKYKQRKLLMACAANYAMSDPRKRSDLGMMGAQALVSIHTEGALLSAAALDEANAFSYLRTPRWLWPWMAAPPVLAIEVWAVLPAALRDTISNSTWVAP